MENKLAIDKSDWKLVKFGDVVQEPKVSIKDPEMAGVKHVIGLEHIEPEDIRLRSSNNLEESTTFTKAFKKGDVLFGRRRAYLKKAAMAEFDGICSGDITVFRAKDNLLPELLPFIVNNDKFFDWAIKHSAGGLSPRVKFKDLANYEFLLPPKYRQAQLAELLWAMDVVVQNDINVFQKISDFFDTSRNSIFSKLETNHILNIQKDLNYRLEKFKNLYDTKSVNGIYKSGNFHGSGVRIINMGELFAYPVIRDEKMSLVELTQKELNQYLVKENDLIFARRSLVVEGAGKCSIIGKHKTPMTFESSLIRVRLNPEQIQSKYVYHFLKSKEGRKQIRRIVGHTTVAGITSSDLGSIKIPIVSKSKQEKILNFLERYRPMINSVNNKILQSKALQKSLINQIF